MIYFNFYLLNYSNFTWKSLRISEHETTIADSENGSDGGEHLVSDELQGSGLEMFDEVILKGHSKFNVQLMLFVELWLKIHVQ